MSISLSTKFWQSKQRKKNSIKQVSIIPHSTDKGCNNRFLCQSILANCNMQVQDQNFKSSVYRSCTVTLFLSHCLHKWIKIKLIGKVHIMFGSNFRLNILKCC